MTSRTGASVALLLLAAAPAVSRGQEDMERTTLRFEATGEDLRVQLDAELGSLVQAGRRDEKGAIVYSRVATGAFVKLAAGWDPHEPVSRVFTTSDGRPWTFADDSDSLSLRERVGDAWKPATIAGKKAVLAEHARLRRGAVHLTAGEVIRSDDGADHLVDGFGVLTYRDGAWRYESLQPLKGAPVEWGRIAWTPGDGKISFRVDRSGMDLPRHVRLAKGVWATFKPEEIAVVSSAGTTVVAKKFARPLAQRGDALLVCAWADTEWELLEVGAEGVRRKVGSAQNALDPPEHVAIDDAGRVWWSDRFLLRRWDEKSVHERVLDARLVGIAAGRALFVRSSTCFSVTVAELDRELDRAPRAGEVVPDALSAAHLDADGRVRALRVVSPEPGQEGPAVHRKVLHRFFTWKDGAWVADEDGKTYETRECALHYCKDCHGGAAKRERPPRGGFTPREMGLLSAGGEPLVVVPRSVSVKKDEAAVIRRKDGHAWLVSPAGVVEVEESPAGGLRPKRLRLFATTGPWIQDAEGEVWLVREHALERVRFP